MIAIHGTTVLAAHRLGRDEPEHVRAEEMSTSRPVAPRVLLVEDDAVIAKMWKTGLEHAGFEIELAEDGFEALAEMQRRPPAIVVLDVRMPRMDGIELLDQMRADPRLRPTRVLILSNYSDRTTVTACRERGAVDYVVKSTITPRELAQRIARWLL